MANQVNDWSKEEKEMLIEQISDALEQVIDPELGIDIVNLGLVYNIEIIKNFQCRIDLTLTTMGCPLADVITDDILHVMKSIPEIKETEVKLVWYPAWSPAKMSRYARIALGIR